MQEKSPNRIGFDLVRTEPLLLFFELLWRWSFGIGVIGVLLVSARFVRDALALGAADEAELNSGDPLQMAQTLARVIALAAPHLLRIAAVLVPLCVLLWVVAATFGRAPVTRIICSRLRPEPRAVSFSMLSLFTVYAVRAVLLLILVIGYMLGSLVGAVVLGPIEQPNFIAGLLVFIVIMSVAILLWSGANFVASLATIEVVRQGLSPLDALVAALRASFRHRADFAKISGLNMTLRTAVAFGISVICVFPAALAAWAGTALATFVVALFTLIYLAASDWLLLARTASYAYVLEQDPHPSAVSNHEQLYSPPSNLRS